MDDLIVIAVVVLILGSAGWYVYKSRKRGIKCIGCPDAKNCSSGNGCAGCSGCKGS